MEKLNIEPDRAIEREAKRLVMRALRQLNRRPLSIHQKFALEAMRRSLRARCQALVAEALRGGEDVDDEAAIQLVRSEARALGAFAEATREVALNVIDGLLEAEELDEAQTMIARELPEVIARGTALDLVPQAPSHIPKRPLPEQIGGRVVFMVAEATGQLGKDPYRTLRAILGLQEIELARWYGVTGDRHDERTRGRWLAILQESMLRFIFRELKGRSDAHLAEPARVKDRVEDIVAKRVLQFEGIGKGSSWLWQITRNETRDEIERRKKTPTPVLLPPPPSDDPELLLLAAGLDGIPGRDELAPAGADTRQMWDRAWFDRVYHEMRPRELAAKWRELLEKREVKPKAKPLLQSPESWPAGRHKNTPTAVKKVLGRWSDGLPDPAELAGDLQDLAAAIADIEEKRPDRYRPRDSGPLVLEAAASGDTGEMTFAIWKWLSELYNEEDRSNYVSQRLRRHRRDVIAPRLRERFEPVLKELRDDLEDDEGPISRLMARLVGPAILPSTIRGAVGDDHEAEDANELRRLIDNAFSCRPNLYHTLKASDLERVGLGLPYRVLDWGDGIAISQPEDDELGNLAFDRANDLIMGEPAWQLAEDAMDELADLCDVARESLAQGFARAYPRSAEALDRAVVSEKPLLEVFLAVRPTPEDLITRLLYLAPNTPQGLETTESHADALRARGINHARARTLRMLIDRIRSSDLV